MTLLQRTFYINVEGIPSDKVKQFVEDSKKLLDPSDEEKYQDTAIVTFFIPVINSPSKLVTECFRLG